MVWPINYFPRSEAHTIPDLRLSPLAVVVSPSKTRIIHDLTLSSSQYACSVNADTDFALPPPVELGRVLRNVIGRILYLRRRFGPRAHIVLSKINVTEAFRQVSVQWAGVPVFGYVFANWSLPIVGCSLDGGVRRGFSFCFPQPSNTLIATRRTTTPW